jgi:electron transfer flavoprotein alpha subunit
MKTLIVAEHDNQTLKAATLNAVAAAQQLGSDIDILVVGSGCQAAADAAAAVPGTRVTIGPRPLHHTITASLSGTQTAPG